MPRRSNIATGCRTSRSSRRRSSKLLWQFKTSSSVNSTAITYTHKGKQYVSIASGMGGILTRRFVGGKVPTGGSLWTFALMPE